MMLQQLQQQAVAVRGLGLPYTIVRPVGESPLSLIFPLLILAVVVHAQ